MKGKSGKVTVGLYHSKLVNGVAVSVGFKCDGNYWTMKTLENCGTNCADLPYETAVAHALFSYVRKRIAGNMADELSNKLSGLSCSLQGGEMMITFQCAGTGTAIKKSVKGVLKSLSPAKVFPMYKRNLYHLSDICEGSMLGARSKDKAHFINVAKKLIADINQGVKVVIAGKHSIKTKAKFDQMVSDLARALVNPGLQGSGEAPRSTSSSRGAPALKSSGFKAVFLKYYLDSLGIQSELVDGGVYVRDGARREVKAAGAIKKIRSHIGKKYAKYGKPNMKGQLIPAMIYLATVRGLVNNSSIMAFGSTSSLTGAQIVSSISTPFRG